MSAGGGHLRRKSKFTYKQLASLGASSTSCPLRVIAHVDLDAFYARRYSGRTHPLFMTVHKALLKHGHSFIWFDQMLSSRYLECEMVRLGVLEDQPLAVQQWYLSIIPFGRNF